MSNMSSKFHINISVFVWFAQTNHGVLYCIYYTSFCMVKLHPISRQLSPLRGHAFPKPVLCSKQMPASAGNTPPAETSSNRSIIRPKHHPSARVLLPFPDRLLRPQHLFRPDRLPGLRKPSPQPVGFLRILKGRKIHQEIRHRQIAQDGIIKEQIVVVAEQDRRPVSRRC